MFRESDYRNPKPHETYVNRQTPTLQAQAQNSKFDEVGKLSKNDLINSDVDNIYKSKILATINDPQPKAIPYASDHYYDPDHPDADWAGLVKSISGEKKHMQNHKSQQVNIKHSEKGIVAVPVDKYEFHKKRLPEPYKNKDDTDEPLIGGIQSYDPYKTTYHSLLAGEKASVDTTLENQQQKMNKFNEMNALRSYQPSYPSSSSNNNNETYEQRTQTTSSSPLTRYSGQKVLGKSLLSNLGSDLVHRVPRHDEYNK